MIQKIAIVAAVILPIWNIPLVIRIIKRRSSEDISLYWAVGVWVCFVLMAPSAFASADIVWRAFNIVNLVCFSIVTFVVLLYRRKK